MNNSANLDLTEGKITTKLWAFAIPLMLGNVLQQLYNLVDTWVVGKYIGENALAAVGSSYTLMTFLTSIIIGLCLGSSAFISMAFGKRREDLIRNGIYISFVIIATLTGILMLISYCGINEILNIMNVPDNVKSGMKIYMLYCLTGFVGIFLYNYVSNVLRGIGNSVIPLIFLGVTVVLNIVLDIYFVRNLEMGIKGAAIATVISEYVSGVGILVYFLMMYPKYHIHREDMKIRGIILEI